MARLRSWIRSVTIARRWSGRWTTSCAFTSIGTSTISVRTGVPVAEARRRAGVEFGGIDARKEDIREALGLRLVDEVTGDLRYAFRQLRRSPVFTAVAVLSLALGIGANSAIFSLMEAALWKPIPVKEPDRLRLFSWVSGPNRVMDLINGRLDQTPGGGTTSTSFSYPVFEELQRQNRMFEHLFAFKSTGRITAVVDGQPELINGELVSGNFYEGVGVRPIVGRPIVPADDRRGAETVAVISDGFWARRFGRERSVVGTRISVNSVPVTIVGVNPPDFTGVEPGATPEIFMPLQSQPEVRPQRGDNTSLLNRPDYWWLLVLGRLKPAVNESQAQIDLDAVFQRTVRDTMPERTDRDQPRLALLSGSRGWDGLSARYSRPLLCTLVARRRCPADRVRECGQSASRPRGDAPARNQSAAGPWRRPMANHAAAPHRRARPGRPGRCGRGAAWLLDARQYSESPGDVMEAESVPGGIQLARRRSLVVATLATGILFSLAPAWRSARLEVNTALKGVARVALKLPRWSRGKPLVVFQVCLAVLLLIGAGLFIRTLSNLTSGGLGFQPERVLLFTVDPPRARYLEANRETRCSGRFIAASARSPASNRRPSPRISPRRRQLADRRRIQTARTLNCAASPGSTTSDTASSRRWAFPFSTGAHLPPATLPRHRPSRL